MKKIFKLNGLDCANCASKIEVAINKLTNVESVSVNFMTTKMILEIEEDKIESTVDEVIKVIKKIEPDIKITNI